jgi:hypothetical protein
MEGLPECIAGPHGLDAQLRAALPDVLGSQASGDLVLGYGQLTAMGANNKITRHIDPSKYGDVIITVGIIGSAQVSLLHSRRGDDFVRGCKGVEVASGSAYGICGCARFHKLHEIWCPETQMLWPELSIKGGEGRTNAPARVGLT